jgi:AraC-like DNA-binding protein
MAMAKRKGVVMLFRDANASLDFARRARSVCLAESRWLGFDFIDIIEGEPIVWSPVDLAVPFVYANSLHAAEQLAERVRREASRFFSKMCLVTPLPSRFLSVPFELKLTVENLHVPLHSSTIGQDVRRFVYETAEDAFIRWLMECRTDWERNAVILATLLRSSTSDTERRRLQRWCARNELPPVGTIRRMLRLGLALWFHERTNLSLSGAAKCFGYSNYPAFSRSVKRVYARSPAQLSHDGKASAVKMLLSTVLGGTREPAAGDPDLARLA